MAQYRNPFNKLVTFSREKDGRFFSVLPNESIDWDDMEQMKRLGMVRVGQEVAVTSVTEVPSEAIPAMFGATMDAKDVLNFLDQNTNVVIKNVDKYKLSKADIKLLISGEQKGKNRTYLLNNLAKRI